MKNLLITGATSSLGRNLAKYIVSNEPEHKLFLISRSHDKELQKLRTKNVKYVSGIDLLEFNYKSNLVEEVNSFFQSSFNIIHSAGDFWLHLPFLEFDTNSAIKMMNSHYGTFYNVLQVFLPHLIQHNGGHILTFSCNATDFHFPNMLPFTAAKAAIDATVKCIANEHSKDGIVINSIALSSLQTEQNKDSKPNGDFKNYLDLNELSIKVLEIINMKGAYLNGNIIKCFNYSDTYFNEGYFQRIKK